MNNDERAIEDGDLPDDLPEESLDTDHFLEAYDHSREEEDLEEDQSETLSQENVEEAGATALSDDELDEADLEAGSEDDLTATAAESAEESAEPAVPPPVFNNFMDALYPKRAPAAQNARIVRRFDLEAAKYDPRPAAGPTPVIMPAPAVPVAPVVPEKKKEPLTREEARALRNRSLRAAAGLD
jgi:hypothetical protein